jgi:diguanylate cyclase (GGDEF)-like protein
MAEFVQRSEKLTLQAHDQSSNQGWRNKLVRLGRWRALLLVSICSIVASVVIAVPMSLLFGASVADLLYITVTSILVPMCVAPTVTHFLMQLLFELEQNRVQLLYVATRDSLTHLYNRRFFMESFEIETSRALRTKGMLGVLMIDIDNFKSINDQYGHATGDIVLQKVARACADAVRPYDIPARLGGEEFVVLLPGVGLKVACDVAERLRVAVENLSILTDSDTAINVTISLGVSILNTDTPNHKSLLDRADQALYSAKHAGKNRWACSIET